MADGSTSPVSPGIELMELGTTPPAAADGSLSRDRPSDLFQELLTSQVGDIHS